MFNCEVRSGACVVEGVCRFTFRRSHTEERVALGVVRVNIGTMEEQVSHRGEVPLVH